MELEEGGDYIPVATLSQPEWSYIMMGNDEGLFNVSLIVKDKVTRPCLLTTIFLKRKES